MTLKANINASNIVDLALSQINANEFTLQIDSNDIQLSLNLNAAQIQMLGLKCVHYIPDIAPTLAVDSEDDMLRIPVKALITLDDRELQHIMREAQPDDIRQLLWFMQDTESFADKFLTNMSQRAADVMRDDLESYYGDQHPNTAESRRTEKARKATQNILNIANNLQSTGEISAF